MTYQYKSDKRNFMNSYGHDSIDPVTITAVGSGLAKGIGSLFGNKKENEEKKARVVFLRNELKRLGIKDPTVGFDGISRVPQRFAKNPAHVGKRYGDTYGRTGLIRDLETLVMEAQGVQVQPERPFTPTVIGSGTPAGVPTDWGFMLPEVTVEGQRLPQQPRVQTAGISLGGGTLTTILIIGLVAVLGFMFLKK